MFYTAFYQLKNNESGVDGLHRRVKGRRNWGEKEGDGDDDGN